MDVELTNDEAMILLNRQPFRVESNGNIIMNNVTTEEIIEAKRIVKESRQKAC